MKQWSQAATKDVSIELKGGSPWEHIFREAGNLQPWRYSENAWTRPQGSLKVRKMEMESNQCSKEVHEERALTLTFRSPLKAV